MNKRKEKQMQEKSRMNNDPVSSQERRKIEAETAISFAGKGKPVFSRKTPKTEAPVEKVEVPAEQKKMAEGVGSNYVGQSHRKVVDTTRGDGRG